MLKDANGRSASIFPPGIMDRDQYQKIRDDEITGLKSDIKSYLAEADQADREGNILYANAQNYNATVAMRRLIEMGAL